MTEIQFLLVRQTSTLRGFLITGDESFLRQYERLSAEEEALYVDLAINR